MLRTPSSRPVQIAISGAAGQIGYALTFRVAAGDMLGPEQPVALRLLEIPDERAQKALRGVMMELEDCAFPLLASQQAFDNPRDAFRDIDVALLVGARPRGPGMERKDLLAANAQIFSAQGKALNDVAKRTVKTLVVGNPANTNAYIAVRSAPDLSPRNFTSMMRLDHNRAVAQIAARLGQPVDKIERLFVWGNHSPAMCPDYRFATAAGRSVREWIGDESWNRETFIPMIERRGSAVIEARGLSSAGSAANAAMDHMRDWIYSTEGRWTTMGVRSDGCYGIPEGLVCGLPVTCHDSDYEIVRDLPLDDFVRSYVERSAAELQEERHAIEALLKSPG